jgi:hypothetical protein
VRTQDRPTGAAVGFATVERTVGPTAVNHQGQLQAITLSFNLAPDVPLGTATKKIDQWAARHAPAAIDHHQLRRRRGGVPEFAGQPADPDPGRRWA